MRYSAKKVKQKLQKFSAAQAFLRKFGRRFDIFFAHLPFSEKS